MKIKRFELSGEIVEHVFLDIDQLKTRVNEWKEEFKRRNHTDRVIEMFGRDGAYENYEKEMNDLVNFWEANG